MKKLFSLLLVISCMLITTTFVFADNTSTTAKIPIKTNIGSTVEVIGNSNLPDESKVFVEGEHVFKLTYTQPGEYKYKIKQSVSTEDLIIDDTVYDVEVVVFNDQNGLNSTVFAVIEGNKTKEFSIEFNNQIKINKKVVKFLKTSSDANEPLAGAEFALVKNNKEVDSWISDTNKYEKELEYGSYTVVEKKAPANYKKIDNFTFEVFENGIVVNESNNAMIHDDTIIIKNNNINIPEQNNPSIGTTLTDENKNKSIIASKETILVDTISYKDLDPAKWYIFTGKLVVKDTGDPLVENGKEITASSEPFKPTSKNGSQKVVFKVDTTKLVGKELVAFEAAYELENYSADSNNTNKDTADNNTTAKKLVATHEDITDESQTVDIVNKQTPAAPSIGTILTDENGNKEVKASKKTTLVDTVEYENLDVTKDYIFYGTLMIKSTGSNLVERGKKIEAVSEQFRPTSKNGSQKVKFTINTENLAGKELVAFEEAYELKAVDNDSNNIDNNKVKNFLDNKSSVKKVATHKDLDDESQTVKISKTVNPITKITRTVKTGDATVITLWIILMLIAIGVLIVIIIKHRKNNKKK